MDAGRRIVVSFHALERFIKYSTKMGRFYPNKQDAQDDLVKRFGKSLFVDTEILRQQNIRHPGSLSFLEDKDLIKVPMIFIGKNDVDYRHRPIFLIITCYPLKGGGSSHDNPRTRDERAKTKRKWQRLVQEQDETMEVENV